MDKSIRQFAEDVGFSHTTIRNVISELETELGRSIGTNQGRGKPTLLSEEEQQIISQWLNRGTSDSCAQVAHPVSASVEIESGNHQVILKAPELPQTYSLEGLRKDTSVQFDDPLEIATQFIEAANLVQTAMQSDIEQREQKLNQTRQAKEAIAAKAQELKLEQRLYRERTHQIDSAQTQETQTLQTLLTVLQGMGKPPAERATGG